ncbi:DUF2808 domain-containing protein [Gloeobacter kilaueensis]|uniref:DUF2808 domain-containing protein n=1 Tax=Gloeobacter kilaueensis (strain ATCC BAA-2537 / CCAP 1431/1 / ULC 316 / JS1) TaxID=1183438 RepID=U5QIE2_GLOK1|nr:DUF2808 domain-containing protein [Gloeobacter kilaueensis]AGY57359.1 hypothetical protein GKIL_1113 [Gloeobacter kilaueensis JS1]
MLKRWLGGIAVVGLLLVGSGHSATAQSGFCLFGCAKEPEYILNYKIENREHDYTSDRYYLWMRPENVAVKQIQILTDPAFDGRFDLKAIDVASRTSGATYAVESTEWDNDQRTVTIVLAKPIPAQEEIQLVFSQVLNPSTDGIYKLVARVLGTEANPIYRYVGTWSISIE